MTQNRLLRLPAVLALLAVLGTAGAARAQSIAYINEDNVTNTNGVPPADGIPDHLGDVVVTTGRVTSIDFRSGYDAYPGNPSIDPPYIEVYFQEPGTTEAIRLFVAQSYDSGYDSSVLTIGDEFIIGAAFKADVTHVHGVTSLEVFPPLVDELVNTGAPNAPIAPTPFTVADLLAAPEDYEGALVSITNLTLTSGNWPARGGSASLVMSDGTGSTTLRIDSDTNLDGQPAPTGPYDLVGIFTQFDTTPPYDGGYQVLPRFYTDIVQAGLPPSPPGLTLTPGTVASAGVGQTVDIDLFGTDTNAADTLTFANIAGPGGGFTDVGDREATFSWIASGPGTTNTFTFTVSDGALSDTQSVDVVVLSAAQADVVLNEFQADPAADISGDANGDGVSHFRDDEFVEIVNRNAGADVDIGDWVLRNGTNVLFTFPSGTILTAQTATVVFGGTQAALDPLQFGNAQVFTATPVGAGSDWHGISNSGGAGSALSLTAANGTPIFNVVYGSLAGENQALNLDPELTGTSYVLHSEISASGGALYSPGTFANGAPFPGSGLSNSPPALEVIDDFAVRIGHAVSVAVSASDVDGNPISLSVSNAPASAVLTDHGDGTGTFEYTGQASDAGANFEVEFIASDGSAADTIHVTLYVPSVTYSGLIINEFLPDPDLGVGVNHIDSNHDGVMDPEQDEFVEIVNLTGAAVDLGGCLLSDAAGFTHTFSGLEIPANGAVVVFGGGSLANFSASPAQLATSGSVGPLNNGGDTLSLWDPATNLLDRVSYADPGVPDAASLNRDPDITGDTFVTHSLVGAGAASPGTRADGSPFLVDQPPTIVVSGSPLVRAGDTLDLTVTASEPDGDTVTLNAVSLPANATFTNTNGVGAVASIFSFTPESSQTGTVQAVFTASDVDGTTTNTVTITVTVGGQSFWDFETGLQGWTTNSLASSRDWGLSTANGGAEGSATYVTINGFTADVGCDDWLISPTLDLTGINVPALTFWVQRGFAGIEANRQFMVSTNYSGSGDPTLADWDVIIIPDPGDSGWPAPPQLMSLNAYATSTNVHVAFRYQSDGPGTTQHNWSVDQIRLEEAANTPPTITVPGPQSVTAGDTVSFTVSASEPDGDLITLTSSNLPAAAVFTDLGTGTGTFEWVTSGADIGTVVMSFTAVDPDGSDTGTVEVSVQGSPFARPCGLIFSEYVEGTSNNKAIELYNGTDAEIDFLAGEYVIVRYNNGSATPSDVYALTGVVASAGTYIVANPSAATEVLALADQTGSATFYNGDDALVLMSGGVSGAVVDCIGRVGEDPGTVWGTEPVTTAEHTLRRMTGIGGGDTVIDDAFDPAVEWDTFAQNDFSGLGAHASDCPGGGVVDTDGDGMSDDYESLYFGGPTNGVAGADEEPDGHNNLEEYIANTDPTDANSFFSIIVIDGAAVRSITLGNTSSERVYEVEYSTGLADPDSWTNLAPAQAGAEPETVVTDPAADATRSYRGKVRLP